MVGSAYRGLIFDLDGTLLVGEDLPDANRLALAAAHKAGYHVIIATARWVQMAHRVADQIGLKDPVIACSGAQVHDRRTGQDLFDERLPLDFTQALYAMCDAQRCIATVTVSDKVLLKLDGEPDPKMMGPEMQWVTKLTGLAEDQPRIAAIQGSALCQQIKTDLAPQYAERVNVFDSIGPTGKLVITITAKGATKGAAVRATCAHLGISPDSCIAFGDAENDLAMFAVCGASVAMGQADALVKSAATHVTAPHDEDGVALAVNRLLATGSV